MPRGHTHDNTHASANTGNTLGDRSSVRQSKLYRQYESGNDVKDILGTGHLSWRTDRKQGVYDGHELYDHMNPYNERDAQKEMSPKRLVTHKENAGVRYSNTFSDGYNKSSARATAAKKQRWEEAAARNTERGDSVESIANLSPSRRAKALQEQFDEDADYEVDWDVQTGRQKLKKTGRRVVGNGSSANAGYSNDSRRDGATASHQLTANERMKLREREFAASLPPQKVTNDNNSGVSRSSPYSTEDVYGPGGESALMSDIDNMDPDSLERLAAGLSQLKSMADEARRLEKLDRLKRELQDLENYVSPQSSPARAQADAPPSLSSSPSAARNRSGGGGSGSPLRGILKTSNNLSPAEGSISREGDARQRQRQRQSSREEEYSRRDLRRTDASKFYNNSFEAAEESHSHRTYGQHDVSRRQQQPNRALRRTDASKFYDASHDSGEVGSRSHSHRAYGHHDSTAPSQPLTSRRNETDARDFYDNSYSSLPHRSNRNNTDGLASTRERPEPPVSFHTHSQLRQEALLSGKITPGEALRQSAPFALDPDIAHDARAPARRTHGEQGRGDPAPPEPVVMRTARTEASRSTKFW